MMRGAVPSILQAIGNTPLVKLHHVAADVAAHVYVKCEFLNPGGSAKDRMALHLADQAEKRGELKPGATIIEATSGNTGAGLAMVAAVRGYKCVFVMPDKMSSEKIASLRAFGAKVVLCPTAVDPGDPRSYLEVAKRLAAETPNAFYANQGHNRDNPDAHYLSTGPELWEQCGGELDVFVAGLGTGGTMSGTGRFLRERKADVRLIGVDGLGESFAGSTVDLAMLDETIRVDDKQSFLMARDLVRLEGLNVGGSSGAAVAGALAYAHRTQKKENIVVLLADGSAKYLSRIFNDDWMRENGFLEEHPGLGLVSDVLKGKTNEVIFARSIDRVREVIGRMKTHGISQLPVLEGGKLLGAVAEVDMLRYLVSGEHSLDSPVGTLAESDYATVKTTTKIEHVQSLLNDVRMTIVFGDNGGDNGGDDDTIVGVITKIDLIDYLARRAV